ncbi:MAG: hypothetical protein M3Q08_03975 [Pseudomonadota bacterium]|nr:hypothetical protein [Pseudomonadota bacterium]
MLNAASGPTRPLTKAETAVIQKEIGQKLIDPQSAQFEMEPYRIGSNFYCGLWNSKNKMGGYAGAELFLIQIGDADAAPRRDTPITAVKEAFIPNDPRWVGRHAPLLELIYGTCAKNGYVADHLRRVGYAPTP